MSYLLMRTKSVSISSQRTEVKLANLCSSAAFAKSSFDTFASSWNTFGNTWESPHTAANTVINVSTLTPHLQNTWQGFTKLVQTGWRCALQLRFHHFTNMYLIDEILHFYELDEMYKQLGWVWYWARLMNTWQAKEVRKANSSQTFRCPQCNRHFRNKGHLNEHVAGVHERNVVVPCPVCHKAFHTKKRMRKHLINSHRTEFTKDTVKPQAEITNLLATEVIQFEIIADNTSWFSLWILTLSKSSVDLKVFGEL